MAQQQNDVIVTSTTERPEGPPKRDDVGTEKIRGDIHRTRSELDQTIDELSERLRPRNLFEDLIDMIGEGESGSRTTKVVRGLGKSMFNTVRQHPIPAALIGAGLAWLAAEEPAEQAAKSADEQGAGMMERVRETTREGMAQASEQVSETTARVRETGAEITERMRETGMAAAQRTREMGASAASTASQWASAVGQGASQAAQRIREGASSLGQQTQQGYAYSRDATARAMDDYPLAVGIGLAALGVLAGLAIPRTRREDELMGETSDRVEEQARSMGQELYQRGRQVGEAAMSTAMDEAERQGLSPEQLRQKTEHVASEAQQMQEEHS